MFNFERILKLHLNNVQYVKFRSDQIDFVDSCWFSDIYCKTEDISFVFFQIISPPC